MPAPPTRKSASPPPLKVSLPPSQQEVHSDRTRERVVVIVADGGHGGPGQEQGLDIVGEGVDGSGRDQHVGTLVRVFDHQVAGHVDIVHVDAPAPDHYVGSSLAEDRVVPVVADQEVGDRVADQGVVAAVADAGRGPGFEEEHLERLGQREQG